MVLGWSAVPKENTYQGISLSVVMQRHDTRHRPGVSKRLYECMMYEEQWQGRLGGLLGWRYAVLVIKWLSS